MQAIQDIEESEDIFEFQSQNKDQTYKNELTLTPRTAGIFLSPRSLSEDFEDYLDEQGNFLKNSNQISSKIQVPLNKITNKKLKESKKIRKEKIPLIKNKKEIKKVKLQKLRKLIKRKDKRAEKDQQSPSFNNSGHPNLRQQLKGIEFDIQKVLFDVQIVRQGIPDPSQQSTDPSQNLYSQDSQPEKQNNQNIPDEEESQIKNDEKPPVNTAPPKKDKEKNCMKYCQDNQLDLEDKKIYKEALKHCKENFGASAKTFRRTKLKLKRKKEKEEQLKLKEEQEIKDDEIKRLSDQNSILLENNQKLEDQLSKALNNLRKARSERNELRKKLKVQK